MVPNWSLIGMTVGVFIAAASSTNFNIQHCARRRIGNNNNETIQLVIGGFFPKSGSVEASKWDYYSSIKPVVSFALDDINNHPCILAGYSLVIEKKDTQCKPAKGMKMLFDTMDSKTPKLAVFGGACTSVNEPLAMTTNYFNMVQVSYAETHPKFTIDKEAYSYFYRMLPSYRNVHSARVQLLKFFNWTRVGIVVQRDDARYALPQEEVQNALQTKLGIKVAVSVGFSASKINDIQKVLITLKKVDARIVLGFFNSSVASHIFCEAMKLGLTRSMYVWVLSSYSNLTWWKDNNSNCTNEELMEAMSNHFLLTFTSLRSDKTKTIKDEAIGEYKSRLNGVCLGQVCSEYQGYIYDGVWTLALALERIIAEHEQSGSTRRFHPNTDIAWSDRERQKMWGQRLLASLNATNFEGVTGLVRFDNNERLGIIQVAQFQNVSYATVGEFDAANEKFFLNDSLIMWPGGFIPHDSIRIRVEKRHVDFVVFCIMCALTVMGMVVAIFFLVVNIYFRNHKFIKMSSPNMNNLIVVGSMLTYLSVVLLGLDTRLVSKEVYGYLCVAKVWTLSFGFTLAFGSMFSKTWRVHSIFTDIKLNKRVITDYKLFLIVFILLLIDLIILVIWLISDNMHWNVTPLPSETYPERNLKVELKIEFCHCRYKMVFQGLLFGLKGLILISGCFLAWETRRVNVPALNDSKYIGMSVYNVVVMCSLGVPISFIISDNSNASYILISVFIIFCTTLTLFLVFIPKIVQLARNPKGGDVKYHQTFMKGVSNNLQRVTSKDSDEGANAELCRVQGENIAWRKMVDDQNRELNRLLKELSKYGDQINVLPTFESTSISRISHGSIPDDPFGGVYIGPPGTQATTQETDSVAIGAKSPTYAEDVNETTSLLKSVLANHYPISRRSTSLKVPTKQRLASSRNSLDKCLIIENESLVNNNGLCRNSIESFDMDQPSTLHRRSPFASVTTPNDLQFGFLSYIDSIRSDDALSGSRTLPSIKESIIGASSKSTKNAANALWDSDSSIVDGDDSYFSTVSSLKSNLVYLSVIGDYNCNDWYGNDNRRRYSYSSSGANEMFTPTDDTVTPTSTAGASRSGVGSRDISRELDCLDPEKLARLTNIAELDSDFSMTGSSSKETLDAVNNNEKKKSTSDNDNDNRTIVQKKRDKFRWLGKLPFGFSKSESGDSRVDDDGHESARPIPVNLIEYKGPECPFIVGTKDFELFSQFADEQP